MSNVGPWLAALDALFAHRRRQGIRVKTLRDALELIGRGNYARLGLLVPLGLAVSATEVIGASLVFGLIGLATGSSAGFDVPVLGDISGRFDVDRETLLVGAAIVMGIFFILNAIVKVAHHYFETRILELMAARLSARMMAGYLRMPYAFHLRRNSSELLRNTSTTVETVFADALEPVVAMIAKVMITVGLLALLLTVSPIATVTAIGVLGLAALIVLVVIQPRLRRLGARKHHLAKEQIKSLQQSFHGIRDVKILGGEKAFAGRYKRLRRDHARTTYRARVWKSIPGEVVELALFGFVLLFFIVAILGPREPSQMLAVLGLFAYAGQRLQSAVTTIVKSLNHLRHGEAPIADLRADLELIQQYEKLEPPPPPLPFEREIRLEHVRFRYEGAHTDALRGIDLTIQAGQVLGICGPTGGGKTTLVDVISGLLEPTAGRVTIDGLDVTDHARAWRQNLGVVPQMVFLTDASLRDNIALIAPDGEIDDDAVEEAVGLAQLRDFVDSLPDGLDTVVGERGVRVSGGQRQRVAIARALYRRPTVLIFDEGTSALDSATEREVIAAIERLRGSHTILMVAHRLSTVRDADRVLLIQDGRIAALGPYDELLATSREFAALAGATNA